MTAFDLEFRSLKVENWVDKDRLLTDLQKVEKRTSGSKLSRLSHAPYKYLNAVLFREFVYKRTKKSKSALASTFFGATMKVELPAATDIYLTGGKTHDSEIRLASYLIKHLKPGDIFVDVGAHYGYFSLLAASLVGEDGQVHAFEAARSNFQLLKHNTERKRNIFIRNNAISDKEEKLTFYEFPALYSEYNSMTIEQYEKEDWFMKYPPVENTVSAIPLSKFLIEKALRPSMIKIDVEGAEDKVAEGLQDYLKDHSPVIIMEYLSSARLNAGHEKAAILLKNLGFYPHQIDPSGQLSPLSNVKSYILKTEIDSDNIVFIKK